MVGYLVWYACINSGFVMVVVGCQESQKLTRRGWDVKGHDGLWRRVRINEQLCTLLNLINKLKKIICNANRRLTMITSCN